MNDVQRYRVNAEECLSAAERCEQPYRRPALAIAEAWGAPRGGYGRTSRDLEQSRSPNVDRIRPAVFYPLDRHWSSLPASARGTERGDLECPAIAQRRYPPHIEWWNFNRGSQPASERLPGHGHRIVWRCPIGACPVPPHLGQTGGRLVSGVAGFKSAITPVPRQAAHLSSSAICFGFVACIGLTSGLAVVSG
jgi:hypothetical protein